MLGLEWKMGLKIVLFQANYGHAYNDQRRSQTRNRGRPHNEAGSDEDTRLKNLIRDIRSSSNETKDFWTKLPFELCKIEVTSDMTSATSSRLRGGQARSRYGRQNEENCWNGRESGRYTASVVLDGLAQQEKNPEVKVDVNRPDVDINEQILALKLITKKLESAHKGLNVDWPSTSNCKPFASLH